MEEKDLPDWDAFQTELRGLLEKYDNPHNPLLFRGLCDSEFDLTTTLEREGCQEMTFGNYYALTASRIKPAIESFTGVIWDTPDYSLTLEDTFRHGDLDTGRTFPDNKFYRYMVYLRHHGFPSPLLDWSHSPYVAAFFAFRDDVSKPAKRSIYVYRETAEGLKVGSDYTMMRRIGQYVQSDPRHFRQRSDYTVCCRRDDDRGWIFCPYKQVTIHPGQDILQKFNLPSRERRKVLQLLDRYNLNAFSLFDSEETLLETMWFREKVLNE